MQGVRLGGFDGCQAYFLFPCACGGRCRACNVFQAVKHLRRCHALRPEPIGQPVKLFCCRVVHGVLSPPVRVFSLRRSAVCRVACCVCIVACSHAVVKRVHTLSAFCTKLYTRFCANCVFTRRRKYDILYLLNYKHRGI